MEGNTQRPVGNTIRESRLGSKYRLNSAAAVSQAISIVRAPC